MRSERNVNVGWINEAAKLTIRFDDIGDQKKEFHDHMEQTLCNSLKCLNSDEWILRLDLSLFSPTKLGAT